MNFNLKNYLSGYFALNMPAPEGTTGDWHPFGKGVIPENSWYGEDYPDRNTLDCLGLYGLHEAGSWLRAYGFNVPNPCFAANHFRAVLDLVKHADSSGVSGVNKCISEEFFDLPWQKKEVLRQALKMAEFYKSDIIYGWVKHESSHSYAFDEAGIFDMKELEKSL